MPTASSHYSDLQYATVNQDGDTWGGITNNYINGLLAKLRDLEDRVIVAEGQLTTINASVDPVNKMNTTLASALQGKEVLSGATTTLSPDPYSGNYTTATTWPAYGSAELASISVPTTLSEVQNFSYQNFANALSPILTAIEAKVTQATADVSAARIDICKTKKLLDAFNAGGVVSMSRVSSPFGFFKMKKIHVSTTVRRYQMVASANSNVSTSVGSFGDTTVPSHSGFEASMPVAPAGQSGTSSQPASLTLPLYSQGTPLSAAYPNAGQTFQAMEVEGREDLMPDSAGLLTATLIRYAENPLTFQITLNFNPALSAIPSLVEFNSSQDGDTNGNSTIQNLENIVVYTSPDLTPCDTNPGGPHFIT